ncbi:hypothetical protein [Rhodohalobacter sp.]|uniref:hypothetical protein n=1 Tax=Rhodohalobacter sp. TaxID=1974210 RepID=UPI002ACE0504|nr:hypothetical protein [Rhodohalobacter sp.]MDZ7758396.1 hypothetical protein [Rhodohalobacter sp.]
MLFGRFVDGMQEPSFNLNAVDRAVATRSGGINNSDMVEAIENQTRRLENVERRVAIDVVNLMTPTKRGVLSRRT